MSDISARKQVPTSVLRSAQMRPHVPHDLYQWLANFQKGQATALFSPSNLRLCMPGIHLSIWGLLTQLFTYVQQIWFLKCSKAFFENSAAKAIWPLLCDSLPWLFLAEYLHGCFNLPWQNVASSSHLPPTSPPPPGPGLCPCALQFPRGLEDLFP